MASRAMAFLKMGRRPRLILLFALHQAGLRRRRQQHPHLQLDARVEAGQRARRFCAVGLDLNIPRGTDVELQAEGAADLLDAVQAGDVPVQDGPDGVLRQAAVDRGPVLGLASFRETTPDRLREIDGRHAGKHTASRGERRLTGLVTVIHHFRYICTCVGSLYRDHGGEADLHSASTPGRAACEDDRRYW